MTTYDGLLMRDNLADNGVVPSPGYPYHSPDIISHSQVEKPDAFFKANYDSNPNEAIELGSRTNRIYVRTKNLSTAAKTGWYISVYRSTASLFTNTNLWKTSPLKTAAGHEHISLANLQPNDIGVGGEAFLLSGVDSEYFCLIGIASSTQVPTIPDPFATFNDYVVWVRANQDVCGNNLTTVRNYPDRTLSRLDEYSNPEDEDVITAFKLTAVRLPVGTTFGVECPPLNDKKQRTITSNSKSRILGAGGISPAKFTGNVTTWVTLPSGTTTWPAGGNVSTDLYVGMDLRHASIVYAENLRSIGVDRSEVTALGRRGRLVRVGSTGTHFVI